MSGRCCLSPSFRISLTPLQRFSLLRHGAVDVHWGSTNSPRCYGEGTADSEKACGEGVRKTEIRVSEYLGVRAGACSRVVWSCCYHLSSS